MSGYRTVAGRGQGEVVIKKSRFICNIAPAVSDEVAREFIESIRKQHYDAAHNCHAYIIDGRTERSNDDGEPGGTAGRPMLEVLRAENLQQVVVVVTRYFGGILLGAGGLIRAYSQATKVGLDAAGMGRQLLYRRLEAVMDYPVYNRLISQLPDRDFSVLDTDFTDVVRLELGLPEADLGATEDWLVDLSCGQCQLNRGGEYYHFKRGN